MNRDDDKLSDFERRLAQALAHVQAPAGFADRVYAATQKSSGRSKLFAVSKRGAWYAAAAILLLSLFGLLAGIRYREQRREQRAEREFDQAIAITDHTLNRTRAQLVRAGIHLEP